MAVFEAGETVAPEIGWKRKSEHLMRLDRLGVTLHTEVHRRGDPARRRRVRPGGRHPPGPPADTVVLAGTVEPDPSLCDELTARLPDLEVRAVGDCTGLGLIQKAVLDGARAGAVL